MKLSPWWQWDLMILMFLMINGLMLRRVYKLLNTRIEQEIEKVREETEARIYGAAYGNLLEFPTAAVDIAPERRVDYLLRGRQEVKDDPVPDNLSGS